MTPRLGTTSIDHLNEAVAAVEIDLSADELAYLEGPSGPMEGIDH